MIYKDLNATANRICPHCELLLFSQNQDKSFFHEFQQTFVVHTNSPAYQLLCISFLQGISYWSITNKSALRGRRIHNFIELWCLVGSGGVDFCVSSTSFQKSNVGWPQQPPTERVSNISEKLDFWWSIPQKATSIGHFGARNDQTIRISRFFDEMRLSRSLRLLRPLRSLRLPRI